MAEKKNSSKIRLILFQDIGLSLLASLLSILAIRWMNDPHPGFTMELAKWLGFAALATYVGILVTKSNKMVLSYLSASAGIKLVNLVIVKEVVLSVVLLFKLVYVPNFSMGLFMIVLDLVFTGFFLLYLRFIYSKLAKEERSVKDMSGRKTVLVSGIDKASVDLAASLEASGEFHVLGFLSSDPKNAGLIIGEKVVYKCSNIDDVNSLRWRFGGVDCIYLGTDTDDLGANKEKGEAASDAFVFHNDGMSKAGHFVKRSFDVVLSGVLLIVFSPLLLLCALAVKLEDGGPVIYSQERIGKSGKPFMIHKFRSMIQDAEAGGAPALYAGENDDRLTKVGAFLRAHHLDELPQLWNVLKGEMSFIGYRPERQFYIDQIVERNPRYKYLYQIRPGVTSYATLYNSYTDTLEKMLTRLDLDLYYLRNHSIAFDLRVLWLTFFNIVVGKKF